MSTFEIQAVPSKRGSDFADLSRIINHAGLLERRTGYYAAKIVLNLLAFAGGWVAFALIGDTWWQLFMAAFFAVMFTQLSFIGHDAGHKQIFRTRRANDAVGHLHAGLTGLSYGWWIGKHTRHHANPNHEDEDPDIDIAVLAFTARQGSAKRGFLRWMAKYQAFLFFPLLLLEGLDLHVSSVQAVRKGEVKSRTLEAGLLIGHFAAYLTAVFLVLSPLTGIVFILVHHALWGLYMGCSFAPGHKGMPTLSAGHELDFLRKQVLTSRNVRGGHAVDFVLGGLNYQIEHHLFPSMPRPSLRRAQVLVREFCEQRGIDYAQCGWPASYGHVLHHLHAVGAPLRATSPNVS
ncbi:fatty acid desaturase family protein [Saccharothrix deserti]|uniref:fatty acid desaturase family protein n=1 Tax=Saccharothrix deserti TaxID=2593674 RepID=UPI00131D88F8|nr:acyl-CoA desaturase [Saccharothrix deserti]